MSAPQNTTIAANLRPGLVQVTYEKLVTDLTANEFAPGTKLQPVRALAQRYGVSYLTTQRALKQLEREGVVDIRAGDGIYVAAKPSPPPAATTVTASHAAAGDAPRTASRSIGVVMPYWIAWSASGGHAVQTIIKGILGRSDRHRWRIELIHSEQTESAAPGFVDKIVEQNLDGVVWLNPALEHRMNLMRLLDRGLLVVNTGRTFDGLPLRSVWVDYDDMAEQMVSHCLERQCAQLALLCGPYLGARADAYTVKILNATRLAMQRHGIDLPDEAICPAFPNPLDHLITTAWLRQRPEVNGIICLHECLLDGVAQLDAENFWSDPERLTLIDVNAEFCANPRRIGRIPVSSIIRPHEAIGQAIVHEFENQWCPAEAEAIPRLTVRLLAPEERPEEEPQTRQAGAP